MKEDIGQVENLGEEVEGEEVAVLLADSARSATPHQRQSTARQHDERQAQISLGHRPQTGHETDLSLVI